MKFWPFLAVSYRKKNLVFSEYQPLIDATYAKLEYLEVKDGSAVDGMRKCIEIKAEDDKNYAYLAGEKLSHYHPENIDKQIDNVRKEYLTHLKKNLKHRFRKEESEMINDLSIILEPSVVLSSKMKK